MSTYTHLCKSSLHHPLCWIPHARLNEGMQPLRWPLNACNTQRNCLFCYSSCHLPSAKDHLDKQSFHLGTTLLAISTLLRAGPCPVMGLSATTRVPTPSSAVISMTQAKIQSPFSCQRVRSQRSSTSEPSQAGKCPQTGICVRQQGHSR